MDGDGDSARPPEGEPEAPPGSPVGGGSFDWAGHAAGARRLKAAARAGKTSDEPHEALLLELVRARDLWPDQPRKVVELYLEACVYFLGRLDPPGELDLSLPLEVALGALQDLARGTTAPWLRATKAGTAESGRPEMVVRALVVAAVEQFRAAGLAASTAYADIARGLHGLDLPVGRTKRTADAATVATWHRRYLRRDAKGLLPDERKLVDACRLARIIRGAGFRAGGTLRDQRVSWTV